MNQSPAPGSFSSLFRSILCWTVPVYFLHTGISHLFSMSLGTSNAISLPWTLLIATLIGCLVTLHHGLVRNRSSLVRFFLLVLLAGLATAGFTIARNTSDPVTRTAGSFLLTTFFCEAWMCLVDFYGRARSDRARWIFGSLVVPAGLLLAIAVIRYFLHGFWMHIPLGQVLRAMTSMGTFAIVILPPQSWTTPEVPKTSPS